MFTDMVGYSALTQKDEAMALKLLEEHRQLLRPFFPKYGGREIKTIGDAFLVEFSSALDATQCAIELQRSLHERNTSISSQEHIRIRIGLHVGDVVDRENDVYGDGVNIAARVQSIAGPDGTTEKYPDTDFDLRD
jgi:adenylate cyclase